MRFYWKELPESREGGIACKIMRAVEFPFRFDVREFCTTEVKQSIDVGARRAFEVDGPRDAGERAVPGLREGVQRQSGAEGRHSAVAAGGRIDPYELCGACRIRWVLRADRHRVPHGRGGGVVRDRAIR